MVERLGDEGAMWVKCKAVYTTASVAYGWAGAVMQVKLPFVCDQPTNGPTDGQ